MNSFLSDNLKKHKDSGISSVILYILLNDLLTLVSKALFFSLQIIDLGGVKFLHGFSFLSIANNFFLIKFLLRFVGEWQIFAFDLCGIAIFF